MAKPPTAEIADTGYTRRLAELMVGTDQVIAVVCVANSPVVIIKSGIGSSSHVAPRLRTEGEIANMLGHDEVASRV